MMTKIEILKIFMDALIENQTLKLEIGTTPFDAQEISFKPSDILEIEIVQSNVEKILSALDLETAIHLTSDPMTAEEAIALDELKEKLKPQIAENRINRIKSAIESELGARGSIMGVDEVFDFMWENIYRNNKSPQEINNADEIEFVKSIKKYIEKMEKVEF